MSHVITLSAWKSACLVLGAHLIYWLKENIVAIVSFERLHLIGAGRDPDTKRRRYIKEKVSDEDFAQIQACVRQALGL